MSDETPDNVRPLFGDATQETGEGMTKEEILEMLASHWASLPPEMKRLGGRLYRLDRLREIGAPQQLIDREIELVRQAIPLLRAFLDAWDDEHPHVT